MSVPGRRFNLPVHSNLSNETRFAIHSQSARASLRSNNAWRGIPVEVGVALIRSGATRWDREGLLLGMTDEPMDAEGRHALSQRVSGGGYPKARLVFCSDRARALDTARLLYPSVPAIVQTGLRPFDYGDFTGRPYIALDEDTHFSGWIAGAHIKPCPGGGNPHAYWARCRQTFSDIVAEAQLKGLGVVIISHLSVILTVLRQHCIPHPVFTDWDIPCGGGFTALCDPQSRALQLTGRI